MQVRLLPKSPIYMHAKAEIAGDEAFIGSENYSTSSLDENREMGLILRGREAAPLRTQFDQDWRLKTLSASVNGSSRLMSFSSESKFSSRVGTVVSDQP